MIGGEDSFACPVGAAVHQSVEQLQAVVAHADGNHHNNFQKIRQD